MKKRSTIYATTLLIALSSPLALAQAKADDKKEPAKEEKAKEEKKEADVKVAIEGNDTMQYNT
ncbi:MAG: hypothetical protein ACI9MB_003960, partial [Verrucomicrobiales bacterium]